jgi:hypothetical protein
VVSSEERAAGRRLRPCLEHRALRAEREIRAQVDSTQVLEGAPGGAALGIEAEAGVGVGKAGDERQAARRTRVFQPDEGRGPRLLPAGLRGRARRRVAAFVHLVAPQQEQRERSRTQAQTSLARERQGAQGFAVVGRRVGAERVARHRAPEPKPAVVQRTARLRPQVHHVIGGVAPEAARRQGVRQVVRPQGIAGVARVGRAGEALGRRAQAQPQLHARRADADVQAAGPHLQPFERVHVGQDRGRAEGRGVGHVEAVDRPGGSRPAVAVGDEQGLLTGLGAAHVHAVEHDPRHVAQDRPRVGGPRHRPQVGRGEDRRRLDDAVAGGRRLRRWRAAGHLDASAAGQGDGHVHSAGGGRGAGRGDELDPVVAGREGGEDGPARRVRGAQEDEARGVEPDGPPRERTLAVPDRDLERARADLAESRGREKRGREERGRECPEERLPSVER